VFSMKSAFHVHNLHMTFIPHSWLFIALETRAKRRVHFIYIISKLYAQCVPHSRLFIACETRVTRRVPLGEQKLLTPQYIQGFVFVDFVLLNI